MEKLVIGEKNLHHILDQAMMIWQDTDKPVERRELFWFQALKNYIKWKTGVDIPVEIELEK